MNNRIYLNYIHCPAHTVDLNIEDKCTLRDSVTRFSTFYYIAQRTTWAPHEETKTVLLQPSPEPQDFSVDDDIKNLEEI